MEAVDRPKYAAGTVYVSSSGRVLLLRRSDGEKNYAGHWSLPGGGAEPGETPEQTADRESNEEMGGTAPTGGLVPLQRRKTPTGLTFHTFERPVDQEFAPRLNGEHSGYSWFRPDDLPSPIHPEVAKVLQTRFTRQNQDSLALDRATVRRVDQDGRLHVEITNISKANICDYAGEEIPRWKELGLDPKRIYRMFRDPMELAKAAPSFNNVPVLREHVPVLTADDHHPELVVGSTGTDAEWVAPYLRNSLVIWSGDDVQGIASGDKCQLSAGYYYDADMTHGVYQGERFDGRMTNISGNHVAVVDVGRAGPDVVVGDAARRSDWIRLISDADHDWTKHFTD